MKKLIKASMAVILCLTLLLGLGVMAFAEPAADEQPADEPVEEVVDTLVAEAPADDAEDNKLVAENADETAEAAEDGAAAETTQKKKGLWAGFVSLFEKAIKGLNKLFHNYGVSIIVTSLLIKLILVPLDIKSKRSMMRISAIQPEINRLQEKYKNDRDKLSQKQMELYKKNNVSPMAGCLPLLIQLPLFFAFFAALRNVSAEMAAFPESFLWIKNIWQPDSPLFAPDGTKISFSLTQGNGYFILAVLSGVTSYLYTKMSQKDTPQQPKKEGGMDMNFMSYLMPIISVWWTAMYTASFGVYWVTSNLFMMASSYLVRIYLEKTEGEKVVTPAD